MTVNNSTGLIDSAVPVCWPTALLSSDCDVLCEQFRGVPLTNGNTIGDYEQGRKSGVHLLKLTDMTANSRACLDSVRQKCCTVFDFDIRDTEAIVQYARYGVDDYFNWHLDSGMGVNRDRKLSISIQLSESSDYSGGDLEFYPGYRPARSRNRGAAIAFAPFVLHRVTPVLSGVRESLVFWLSGPPFR